MDGRLILVQGDITTLIVDAIVNAANSSLLGGGGVDGAIHRAAGPELVHECRLLGGCKIGDAKLTKGYNLPARFIIHTVGPVWQGGYYTEPELLASCYRRCLEIAIAHTCRTIAFPCISTGIYRFPKEQAAAIALHTCRGLLAQTEPEMVVTFCCYDAENFAIYQEQLRTDET